MGIKAAVLIGALASQVSAGPNTGVVPRGRQYGRLRVAPAAAGGGLAMKLAADAVADGPEASAPAQPAAIMRIVVSGLPPEQSRVLQELESWEAAPRPAMSVAASSSGDDACGAIPPGGGSEENLLKSAGDGDAIDLRRVVVVKGENIADWEVTSRMTRVLASNRDGLCTGHTRSGLWPRLAFFGDPQVEVEGNQWVFARINGTWYGGAGEWLRPGQTCKGVVPVSHVGCGVFYDSQPLKSWVPRRGELVGFAVSAPARAGRWGEAERSNVVLIRWP